MPEPLDRQSLSRRVWRSKVLRYLAVGGSAFLVDAGMLALFREVLNWQVWVSAGVAFVLSFFFTYFAQRMFAFGSDLPHGNALVRYLALVIFNTAATAGIVALVAVTPLGWFGGKVLSTVACTIWNYFIYRWWVFPTTSAEAEQTSAESLKRIVSKDADILER